MDMNYKYQDILDDVLLKSGIVLFTGAKDELGCHLIIFQSHQQSLFIQLDYSTLVQSIYSILTYYNNPLISFLVNIHQSSPLFIEHFFEVTSQVQKKLSKSEIKRLYLIKPAQKSSQKSFSKELKRIETKKKLSTQIVIVKNLDELHQYIKVKNLTPDFGGVLFHDPKAWTSVQKVLNEYYFLVDEIAKSLPNIVEKVHSLALGGSTSRLAKNNTEHSLRKKLQKAEHKKNTFLRQCKFTKALEEGQRFRSYFQDPSLNEEFDALSKTALFEWDRIKFNAFYRKALNMRNNVEKSWKDGVDHLELIAREQRLYECLSECCAWIVDRGQPYLMRVSAQNTTLGEAETQKITFENEFYKQAKDILKRSRLAVEEVRNHQASFDTTTSSSLEILADNLTSLTDTFQDKMEQQMEHYEKQYSFMQVLNKAETWYEKSRQFWPSRLGPSSHRGNTYLSPSAMTDISQSECDLELFLERYPPLTAKELGLLMEYLDNIDDMELRNHARLLGNRCHEMERILRARETHLIDTSSEDWVVEGSLKLINSQRLTDNIDGNWSGLSQSLSRDQQALNKYKTLSSKTTQRYSHSPVIPHHPSYPNKARMNRETNILSSTKLSNDESASLKLDMNTSLSGTRTLGVAGEEETGAECGESRIMKIKRRLRDQELLYEQLIIEEELSDMKDSEERSAEGYDLELTGGALNLSCEGEWWDGTTKLRGGVASFSRTSNHVTREPVNFYTGLYEDKEVRSNFTQDSFTDTTSLRENTFHSATPSKTSQTDEATPETGHTSGYYGDLQETPPLSSQSAYQRQYASAVTIGQQQSRDDHMTSCNRFELAEGVEEKLKIAREAEEHWTRVKDEQRTHLSHVIYDVKKRKEIEDIYFNAQVQLCKVRRDIRMLNKPNPSPLKLSRTTANNIPEPTSTADKSVELQRFESQNLRGAFHPYVKDDVIRSDQNVIGSCSLNNSQSEFEGMLQEDELMREELASDAGDDLGLTTEQSAHDECNQTPLEHSGSAQTTQAPCQGNGTHIDAEDEEEGSSDEFEDDEEEELMILQSDSSCERQDELKDSLRDEQEKLEEMFRQQKELFRKEQEKLKEEEEKIKEWETRRYSPGDEEEEEEMVERNWENSVHEEWRKEGGRHEGKLEQQERQQKQQQQQQQQQEQQQQQQKQQQEEQQQKQEQQQQQQKQQQQEQQQKQEQQQQQQQQQKQQQQQQQQKEQQLQQHQKQQQQKQQAEEKQQQQQEQQEEYRHNNQIKEKQITQATSDHHLIQSNKSSSAASPPTMASYVTSVDTLDAILSAQHDGSDEEKAYSEDDVYDLDQIAVNNYDTEDETRGEIEEELIRILKDGRSTDEDELTDEEIEYKEEKTKQKEMKLNQTEFSQSEKMNEDDIDRMNHMIDDLMISDQRVLEQDDESTVNVDYELNMASPSVDTKLDIDGNERKIMNDDISLHHERDQGSLEGYEAAMRRSRIDHDAEESCVTNTSCYLGSSDALIDSTDTLHDENESIDVDFNIDLNGSASVFKDDHLSLMDLLRGTNELDASEGSLDDEDEIHIGTPEDNEVPGEICVDNDVHIGIPEEICVDNHVHVGIPEDNDLHVGIPEDSEVHAGIPEDNDLHMGIPEDNEVHTGIPEDNEVHVGIPEDNEVHVWIPEDNEAHVGIPEDNDLHVGIPEDNEVHMGIPGDNDLHVGIAEDNEVHVGIPEDNAIHVGVPEDNEVPVGIAKADENSTGAVDHVRNSRVVEQDRTLVNSEDDSMKSSVANGILVDIKGHVGISGDDKRHDVIDVDSESSNEEQYLRSESGEESDSDFGTVLEDIEEEGSEYEEPVADHTTPRNNNNHEVHDDDIMVCATSALHVSRSTHNNIEGHTVNNTSFSSSVIIDAGSGYCKAGFSVDEKPRVVFPSVVGKPRSLQSITGRYKDHYVGHDATRLHQVLTLHHPLKNGVVEDWDEMEKLLDQVYNELRCESDEYPVLLSEPALNPKTNREQIIQMMFETFHVPAAYTCVQAVLALFATGKTTGLVYDCGHGVTYSVPIYEGYALPHATKRLDLGGRELTLCLSRMLRDGGTSLQTPAELEVVQDIKEKLCYVVVDYDTERKAYNTGERQDSIYRMPDGQTILIGSERFRCPEVLFTPSIMGLVSDGIHEVIYKTALQCSIDIRSTLFKNIVLSGGTTMFPGLSRRLHVELSKLLGTKAPDRVQIDAPKDRNVLVWQGGSMLCKLSNFPSMWITAQDYEEFGPAVVHKKCV